MRTICRLVVLLLLAWASPALAYPPPVPAQLVLTVRDTEGIARTGEVVRSGVPLPRSLAVTSTAGLAVVDGGGTPVPAQFRILARWNAGLAVTAAPVQWVLVSFPATVAANGTATYRVVTDGSVVNPAPATPLTLAQVGNQVTVATGAGTFVLGGAAGTLFDSVSGGDGTLLATGGALTARTAATDYTHPTLRRVFVEESGPLAAVVVVEGQYAMPATGAVTAGGLGSRRRYLFTMGSGTALVRHAVAWEGDHCGIGTIECPQLNALRLERARDTMTLSIAAPYAVQAVGSFAAAAQTGTAAAGQSAAVRQLRRALRTDALSFTTDIAGATANGVEADGGVLSVSTAAGALAVAADHLHRYEPRAVRLLAGGTLAIDVADAEQWLGMRQGIFASFAVAALPANPTRADLDRRVWAPLNHPLRAWPTAQWFSASEATDEIPWTVPPANLAGYDPLVAQVLATTMTEVDNKGLAGGMTFGLYPRYWGNPLYGDEIDCGGADPTPADSWDETYWCSTWTDYHNTVMTAPSRAMRNGEVRWLDEIGTPGALRMLHTQTMQCSPADGFFYCGQAPAGYNGYRSDNNASHGYFDNMIFYYWLTGDTQVLDTLSRGATSMRNYLCTSRPASPCLATDPPTDEWAGLAGRVASQWLGAFRFVGLAGSDASYLDDWRSGYARALTQFYVEGTRNARTYGFLVDGPLAGAGAYTTGQLWMASLYDMNGLYRLQVETQNAALGIPAITPSSVIASWGRTLTDLGSTLAPGGTGTAAGPWPNSIDFTWAAPRIGGTITAVSATPGGSDPLLYDTGKATLTATLARAAEGTGDATIRTMAEDMTELAINAATNDGSPLGKLQGEFLTRTHAAVARLSEAACTDDATLGDLDLNATRNAVDLVILANFLVGNVAPGTPPFNAPAAAADLDVDGDVDATDLVILANALVGNIPCLPV